MAAAVHSVVAVVYLVGAAVCLSVAAAGSVVADLHLPVAAPVVHWSMVEVHSMVAAQLVPAAVELSEAAAVQLSELALAAAH